MVKKATAVEPLRRTFSFDKAILPDPDPDMTAEEVKIFYGNQYPELLNSKTEEKVVKGVTTFNFVKQTRTLG